MAHVEKYIRSAIGHMTKLAFKPKYILWMDLEMTGLQVKTDRILEIGAVRLVDGQLRDTFQTFVNLEEQSPYRGEKYLLISMK